MIYIPNPNHDPALNLAQEEYILTASGIREPVLFFYVNSPSIIIGRHQNTLDEINSDFAKENQIQIVRRCSGGGAVYHDLGNLNYSLIRPGDSRASADFSVLLVPILSALKDMGLNAELNGRNDLTWNDAKFSGNAYYHNRSGSVIHGTLLFDSDLDVLSKALLPHPEKIRSKGIQSIRSRVCCIKDAMPQISGVEELEAGIVRYFKQNEDLSVRNFSPEDREKAEALADSRYRNDAWTYGESPAYNIRRQFHQPSGWIDFRADVRDGMIESVRLFGDYFCSGEISDLEAALTGTSWTQESLLNTLRKAKWESYFPEFPAEQLIELLFTTKADA